MNERCRRKQQEVKIYMVTFAMNGTTDGLSGSQAWRCSTTNDDYCANTHDARPGKATRYRYGR